MRKITLTISAAALCGGLLALAPMSAAFGRSGGVNRQSRYGKRRSFDSPLLRVLSPSPSPSLLVALWPSPLPLVMKGAQVGRAVKVTVYTTDHSSRPSIFIAEQFFKVGAWLDLRCNRHVRFGS